MLSKVVAPLCYLPSIEFFALQMNSERFVIEQHENFIKSTYRNRCSLAGANGRLDLSIPIKGGKDHHARYRDVRINNTDKWQRSHWQSIISCYGRSPYFEYYDYQLKPLFDKEQEFLFDFNLALLHLLNKMIKLPAEVQLTALYEDKSCFNLDLRTAFKPSKTIISDQYLFTPPVYTQCFGPKYPFIPNLSILDLLFAEGPRTKTIIQQSIHI
jgi:hypothetical protein